MEPIAQFSFVFACIKWLHWLWVSCPKFFSSTVTFFLFLCQHTSLYSRLRMNDSFPEINWKRFIWSKCDVGIYQDDRLNVNISLAIILLIFFRKKREMNSNVKKNAALTHVKLSKTALPPYSLCIRCCIIS